MEKDSVDVRHIESGVDAKNHGDDPTLGGSKIIEKAYHDEDTFEKTKKSAAERKLLRKTDLVIVPLCSLIYFTAYLV